MKSRLTIFVTIIVLGAAPVWAANPDTQNYRHAFALIDNNHALEADVFARGHDPVLNKVIHAIYMAQPGSDVGFEEMADFINRNPDWPGLRGITAIAEQKIPASWPAPQILAWFEAHPPVSIEGFYRYIDALNISGQAALAMTKIHSRWVDGDFSGDELIAFRARFQQLLTSDDDWGRLDRLLWKQDGVGVHHMWSFIDGGMKAVAEARLGLATRTGNVDELIDRVPRAWSSEPGLLYERLRWHVRNNQDDQAISLLRHVPENPGKADSWWEQRQIMTRRLIARQDYEGAYELVSNHETLDGRSLVEAEFLSGWLALRFLNSLEDARRHFQILLDHAATPISRARGAYWMGRTYEAHGDKAGAEPWYETAAALNITYYGQLAAARIYDNPVMAATPEPTIPANVRNDFYNRDVIRAVEHLAAIGEQDRVHSFFHAAIDNSQQRADFALLTELAYRIDRPDFAIEAGKAASQKNMLMGVGGFPLLERSLPHPPDPAFTHALIRQESMFNPQAHSPVGAEGLMQLMPATAKGVAKKLGIRFKPGMLTEPDYNLRLGTAFVAEQIDNFQGSYVLALAGYNAGPHRVREWMTQIGDPRDKNTDAVDWVELIPISETRNYVERIIESLQVYRARLAGGKAPLQILQDLKR